MVNLLAGLDTTSNPRFLENQLLMLRTESVDLRAILTNFTTTVKSSAGNMVHFLIFLTSFDGNNKTAEAVSRLIGQTEKKIENMNFILFGETAVPCPDGFTEDFSAYVAVLRAEQQQLLGNALASLEDFNTYLASFIGDKDSKISLTDNHKKYQTLKMTRENQVKKFESFFTHGVNQRQYLNKMFSSKAGIVATAKESVDLWKHVRMINPKDIEAKCQVISQRLQMVLDQQSSSSKSEVSKQALVNLAEGSYEVARQVEHLGLFLARSEIASVTMGNVLERLNKIIH